MLFAKVLLVAVTNASSSLRFADLVVGPLMHRDSGLVLRAKLGKRPRRAVLLPTRPLSVLHVGLVAMLWQEVPRVLHVSARGATLWAPVHAMHVVLEPLRTCQQQFPQLSVSSVVLEDSARLLGDPPALRVTLARIKIRQGKRSASSVALALWRSRQADPSVTAATPGVFL